MRVKIDGECVCVLAYADDLVILAESESDLNILLDCLHKWCEDNKMRINPAKSKVVHFRPRSVTKTDIRFMCGDAELDTVESYKYLGLLLTEYLDYQRMGKAVACSANRALALLISKFKCLGGMCYRSYSKLYDTIVWSTIEYGSAIWGTYNIPAINSVQNRAARFFLWDLTNMHRMQRHRATWAGPHPL